MSDIANISIPRIDIEIRWFYEIVPMRLYDGEKARQHLASVEC